MDLIDRFPELENMKEFQDFVQAVRAKETEKGITMCKMRAWLSKDQMPMKSVRDILRTDPVWKKDDKWRRRLMTLVMTVRLPGSRMPLSQPVLTVLRSAVVENISFDEVCARVRRVDPTADNDHVRTWLTEEGSHNTRETVPSVDGVSENHTLSLDEDDGDSEDDQTIPMSRLDQMSRAPETVRSTGALRQGAPPQNIATGPRMVNDEDVKKLDIVERLNRVDPAVLDKEVLLCAHR